MKIVEDALDKFFAPGISALNQYSAPDIQSHFTNSEHWIEIYILNRVIGSTLVGTTHPVVLNYLRRVHSAWEEYSVAGKQLQSFLNSQRDEFSKYLSAILHFELTISLTYQSCMLLRLLFHEEKFFEKGDQSPLERLNLMYNHTKHVDSCIVNGNLPDGYSIPMWISNSGLHCASSSITFSEIADILKVLATNAERLHSPSSSFKTK